MTIEQSVVDGIRAHTDMVMLVGQTVPLKKHGAVFLGLCPAHAEKTPSFKVDNKRHTYKCFGCGFGGDAIAWIQWRDNIDFPKAVAYLSNGATHTNGHANGHDIAPAKERVKAAFITPVPADVEPPDFIHIRHGKPTTVWTYRNAAGEVMNYVARYDPPGEKKQFSPWSWTTKGWAMKGLPAPRPLFGLRELAERPEAPVLVTEGERACMAARKLLPDYVCVTWHGGTSAPQHTDWGPLKGRTLVCWPDNDDVGLTAMKQVCKLAKVAGRILTPPAGVEKGFDAADATAEQALEMLKGPLPADAPPEPEPPVEPPVFDPAMASRDWPFGLLGHRNGTYFYLPNAGGTVIALGGASHSKNALLMLARLSFWETEFSAFDKKGYDMVANALIIEQHKQGIYDPTRLRGRGAWWDEGRVVVHIGDRLVVDGEIMPIKDFKTEFLYEVSPKIRYVEAKPLGNADANKLVDLCKLLNWERPLSAYLLAGWIALAPVCGALKWRSNVFLTGVAGSGKTWIYQNIICKIVGPAGYALAANVSEPGIRRTLGSDAMPVMIDELEARDVMAAQRIEAIMGLMRYSSSETDAMIVKGSNSGAGVEFFKIRSMFCTLAIGSLITDYADASRTSVLSLKAVHGMAGELKFQAIEDMQRALLTEAWIDGLRTRIIRAIPTIRHNAEVFSAAGAKVLGTRRLGDQLGTLLAGAYALSSTQRISPEKAQEWLEQQDWSEEKEIILDTDGPACFARIMEHQVMCEVATGGGHVRRSMGELMTIVAKRTWDGSVSYDTAVATARRSGLVYQDGFVVVSNTHSEVAKILYDTPWSANWHRRLKSIKGAESSKAAVSYGTSVTRAILVPWRAE